MSSSLTHTVSVGGGEQNSREGAKQIAGYLWPGITLGSIMTAIAKYVDWWTPWAFLSGVAVFVVVTLALARYKNAISETSLEQKRPLIEPHHLILVGLAGIVI